MIDILLGSGMQSQNQQSNLLAWRGQAGDVGPTTTVDARGGYLELRSRTRTPAYLGPSAPVQT